MVSPRPLGGATGVASFLIGSGGKLAGDLPRMEEQLAEDNFMDTEAAGLARGAIKVSEIAI
jgi:hypothetical protein